MFIIKAMQYLYLINERLDLVRMPSDFETVQYKLFSQQTNGERDLVSSDVSFIF